MNKENLIITIYATDRPGIVKALSDTILAHKGSWLESSLSRLCGQFAGIVHVEVPSAKKDDLLAQLAKLASDDIHVTLQNADMSGEYNELCESLDIVVEANDRPGIVEEIASALSASNINVEQMVTERVSASMAGYELFRAQLRVMLPETCAVEGLEEALENVSDDLIVNLMVDD